MSNRDLLRQFADGTPLGADTLQRLMNEGYLGDIGEGRLMLTTAGRILLGQTLLPPGDSASCPDDDSYLPPQHSPGGWIDPPVRPDRGALGKQEGGAHYKDHTIQPIEYIHANKLGFIEGNVVKYITRHGSKGGAADVRKVIHYCELLLQLQYGEKA